MSNAKIFSRYGYLFLFILGVVATLLISFFVDFEVTPFKNYPLFRGFGGNLTSGVIGGILFLFLALFLDAQTEEKIDHIKDVTTKSEKIISEREQKIQEERDILHFDNFMKNESYHNITLPDLNGISYAIKPVRDAQTREPIMRTSEMGSSYIILVEHPAYLTVMSPVDLLEYDSSPIKDNCYYFCQFYNGSWHLSESNIGDRGYKFYLSSKGGHIEYGHAANEFMANRIDPFAGMLRKESFVLREDSGLILTETGVGGVPAELYQDQHGKVFLKISTSLPKEIYFTNYQEEYGDTFPIFVIDDMRGYASGVKLENIKRFIAERCQALSLSPRKIRWYELPEEKQLKSPAHSS